MALNYWAFRGQPRSSDKSVHTAADSAPHVRCLTGGGMAIHQNSGSGTLLRRALSSGALLAIAMVPAIDNASAQQAQAEWTTPAGTVQGTRFSSLAEINTTNVGQLKEEFSFKTGSASGFEGAPLVVGSTMYVVGPFPNKLFALDLTRPGHTRWVFDPGADPFAQDKACCDVVNR
ncbi:MAG TPA: hypothetical protein VFL55_25080, partial [Acetobacteraceae bacterium]|nr:hypothetical protein [Acetobacteraceae bacterium]